MRKFLPLFLLSPLLAHDAQVLLISPPELEEAWQSYAYVRGEQGTAMKVISTEKIAQDFEGPDLQEKIRLCARKHIDEHGYHSIILGGDSSGEAGLIPDRDTFHRNMWGNDRDIPSDLYYISPTNWDHDGDGTYGEFVDDREAITYPDGSVAIGRIPVRTVEDIRAYREKVATHLAAKPSTQLALTCTVRGAYAKVYRAGSEVIPAAWPEGEVSFFFNDITSWDGYGEKGSYDLSNANLSEKFATEGSHKWHLHGHGLADRWILENDESFTYSTVKALKNEQPLVITTVSCFTGHFDAKKDPCITEAMLRQPKGGAVLIVAPAREGKPHFHDPKNDFQLMTREGKPDGTTQTMRDFWVAALGEEKKTAGMALSTSKAGLADDAVKSATYHQGICEINLLGDPTLPVQ